MWRLGVVAVVAVGAFWAAVIDFREAAQRGCAPQGREDASYSATIDPRPDNLITVYHISVSRSGRPVTGARVCLIVDMGTGGMSGMVLSQAAREVSPGRYDVEAYFPMDGGWGGDVLVIQRGEGPVVIPIEFEVR